MLSQSNQYLGAFPSVATAVSVVQCVCVCFVLVLMRLPPPCPVCVFSVKCIRSAALWCDVDGGDCAHSTPCGQVPIENVRVHFILLILIHAQVAVSKLLKQERPLPRLGPDTPVRKRETPHVCAPCVSYGSLSHAMKLAA